jgi:hypothetical protein
MAMLAASGLVAAAFFTIRTSSEDPASEQRTLPTPDARVRVEVLNGGGVAGAARLGTDAARAAGFDVVFFGNATTFDHVESEVVDRVGRPEYAEAVAEALGIRNVRSEPDPDLYVDVSVILGSEWVPPEGSDEPEAEPGVDP